MDLSNMPNGSYDILKILSSLILPIGTFVTCLMTTWHIPYSEEVMKTFAALNVLIGTIVGIAKKQYDAKNEVGRE